MTQSTAQQRAADLFAAITGPNTPAANAVELSEDELREQGYVIGMTADENEVAYFGEIRCKHPALSQSTAHTLITECPEDAWAEHPKGGGQRTDSTDALDEGNLFDKLLTGGWDFGAAGAEQLWERTKGSGKKQEVERCSYTDVNGFRVIEADGYTKRIAQDIRDDAREKGLVPILSEKLADALKRLETIRARLELAGVDLNAGKRQVSVYWVEYASDGTPVQCRGRLDQLDGWMIRDLKTTDTLQPQRWARKSYEYGYHIQAAAYVRALERITGEYGRFSFEWVLVRKGDRPMCPRRPIGNSLLECGNAEWEYAVNKWAKCLKAGLFSGYEMQPVEPVEAEPWMLARTEQLIGDAQDEFVVTNNGEYSDGK